MPPRPQPETKPSKPIIARSLTTLGLACVLLVACDGTSSRGPGGVSEGEARALDEAAEMLDAQRLPDEALPSPVAPPAGDAPETEEQAGEMSGDNTAETPQ